MCRWIAIPLLIRPLLLHLQYPRPFQLRSISFDWFGLVSRNEVVKFSRVYLNFVGFWPRESPEYIFPNILAGKRHQRLQARDIDVTLLNLGVA